MNLQLLKHQIITLLKSYISHIRTMAEETSGDGPLVKVKTPLDFHLSPETLDVLLHLPSSSLLRPSLVMPEQQEMHRAAGQERSYEAKRYLLKGKIL